jgi:tetratricopeptide (TPR) repeat protein
MQEIKAFVAHSFSSADKGLIDTFVGHFRNLEKVLPHFSWDHAQEAEPVPVSGKVLARIEDKNVFIAICTRMELVVPDKALSKIPFFKVTTVNERQLEWKTSDWIIQEIGLAVGRKMSVIVFLENDLRKPGGLIGDIEYIQFVRSDLLPAFEKLLQMLGALKPKAPAVEKISETAAAPKEEEKKIGGLSDEMEPALDWDQQKYDFALFRSIIRREKQFFDKIDTAYRATPLAQGESLAVWEAKIEFLRMLNKEKFDFEKLKRSSQAYPNNALLLVYLARAFQEFEEHRVAAETYEQAAENAAEKSESIQYRGEAAGEYARAGMIQKAREIVEKIRNDVAEEPTRKDEALSALRDFAELEKDTDLQLAIMEQMVELRPSDVSLRFSLAYEHAQRGNRDMALFHYLKIPTSQRTSTTWNNLGVSFSAIGMPVRAVGAWRTSAKENDTLAKSNLGFKLLGAGFWDEAKGMRRSA